MTIDTSGIKDDWEDVSEADWQVNSAKAQRNKITAARLSALGTVVKELASQNGTSGTVPIFGSQAEALAFEAANPGKVALWFDAPTSVTATAPTFTDVSGTASDTYTIPTKAGVVYKVAGAIKAAGTHPGSGTVTITAEAAEGYTLTGTASWSHTFSTATEDIPVTPTGPTWTDDAINGGGTWTTPTETGVTYSPVSGTATPDQEVTVTATATSGYVLTGTTSWSHTFPSAPAANPLVTTFADDTVGQPPSGWTTPWSTTGLGTWQVVADAGAFGGKCLRVQGATGTTRRAFAWSPEGVSLAADVEMLFKARANDSTVVVRPALHISGGPATESVIYSISSSANWTVGGFNNGTLVSGGFGNISTPGVGGTGIWRMIRYRISGTTVSLKSWQYGTAEPAEWGGSLTITPGAHLDPGAVGFAVTTEMGTKTFDFDWISLAVDGATATNPEA